MRILLLGPPGSGKVPLSERLAEKFGLPVVTISNVLRAAAAEPTELGRLAKEAIELNRVSDELQLALLRLRLAQPDLKNGFVLVDFPRNAGQADVLDSMLEDLGRPIDVALLLEADNDDLMERLVGRITCDNCGAEYNIYVNPPLVEGACDRCGARVSRRPDDYEETIGNRLRVYGTLVGPLAQYYELHGKLHRIGADGPDTRTWQRVEKIVGRITPASDAADDAEPAEAVKPRAAAKQAATAKAVAKKSAAKPASTGKSTPKQVTAKKATAKKAAAKKAATKKAATKKAATKKAAAKKATAKKAAAKKATAKKATAKKATAKKATAKKATAKKATAKKATAKKATAKKATAKKATAKKATAKKATAKKAATKKAATKKAATKKAATKKAATKKAATKKAATKKAATKKAATKKAAAKKAAAKKAAAKKAAATKAASRRGGGSAPRRRAK